nr:contact-dependent growth inhibition system immunity protein [Acetobacter sicerae]
MKKPKRIIKRRPYGTKRKSCQINRTDRWISVVSNVIWSGLHFSPTGFAVHSPRDVTPGWIGAAVRKALEASEYLTPPAGSDPAPRIAMEACSNERRLAFWEDLASTYGYKNVGASWKKFDALFVSWFYETEPDIEILSSKSSRVGAHSAWPSNMDEGRVFHVPFAASDAEIGEMVLRAFSRCEGPGKSTEPLFP